LSDTEVVRHGTSPTNSVSCLGKSPTGRCPTRKVIERKLSETDYPVSCGLPFLTDSKGTKAILVSFHNAQSGCGAHTSSLSCQPRSKTTPYHYNWTFQKKKYWCLTSSALAAGAGVMLKARSILSYRPRSKTTRAH